jgi:hypothetical protein
MRGAAGVESGGVLTRSVVMGEEGRRERGGEWRVRGQGAATEKSWLRETIKKQ